MHPVNKLLRQLPQARINQGEIFVAKEPTLVSTILGSCVTICLFHPRQIAGAMCHCQLPNAPVDTANNPLCYVDKTLPVMINELHKLGVPYREMQAKLFGGAMVTGLQGKMALHNRVGPANVEKARQVLQQYALPLVAECVGGHKGYKIFFHSSNGDVYLSRLKNSQIS